VDAASELRRLARAEGRDEDLADPRLQRFFECWLDTFVFQGAVDAELRELAILRVMWRRGRAYEWGNHYRLARRAGLTDEEILAVRTDDVARDLVGAREIVVRAADEVVDGAAVSEATLADLRAVLTDALLDELLYVLAGYQMYATVSASKRDEHPDASWPPDGVGPVSWR
jgi:alkylhydroperoxidase family enzyme